MRSSVYRCPKCGKRALTRFVRCMECDRLPIVDETEDDGGGDPPVRDIWAREYEGSWD